jgi:hypothetical protein
MRPIHEDTRDTAIKMVQVAIGVDNWNPAFEAACYTAVMLSQVIARDAKVDPVSLLASTVERCIETLDDTDLRSVEPQEKEPK